jgi:hypothetical protein
MVLGFELRRYVLAGQVFCHLRHFSSPFCSVFLEIGLAFCPDQPGPQSSYFKLSTIGGMTGVCHHTQLFSIEKGVSKTILSQWPVAVILLISASQVIRITGVSHWHLALDIIVL